MQLFHDTPGRISGGEVLYEGENLLDLSERDMRKVRGKDISMIFQDPMTSLNPVLKIGRQMREVLQLHLNMSKEEAHEHAIKMLRSVGIPRPESIMEEIGRASCRERV